MCRGGGEIRRVLYCTPVLLPCFFLHTTDVCVSDLYGLADWDMIERAVSSTHSRARKVTVPHRYGLCCDSAMLEKGPGRCTLCSMGDVSSILLTPEFSIFCPVPSPSLLPRCDSSSQCYSGKGLFFPPKMSTLLACSSRKIICF